MPSKKRSTSARSPDIIINKPISILKRDIKVDQAGLFKSIGKVVLHIGTAKFWELAADAGELKASFGLKPDVGGLCWYLIRRSLEKAMLTLSEEAWIHRTDKPFPSEDVGQKLDSEMDGLTLEINASFFRQPGNLPFLRVLPGFPWCDYAG